MQFGRTSSVESSVDRDACVLTRCCRPATRMRARPWMLSSRKWPPSPPSSTRSHSQSLRRRSVLPDRLTRWRRQLSTPTPLATFSLRPQSSQRAEALLFSAARHGVKPQRGVTFPAVTDIYPSTAVALLPGYDPLRALYFSACTERVLLYNVPTSGPNQRTLRHAVLLAFSGRCRWRCTLVYGNFDAQQRSTPRRRT